MLYTYSITLGDYHVKEKKTTKKTPKKQQKQRGPEITCNSERLHEQ